MTTPGLKSFKQYVNESEKRVLPASLLSVKPSSKEQREKIHEPKKVDRKAANLMASFQQGENRGLNRSMRAGQNLSNTSQESHLNIKNAFMETIGRGTKEKGHAVSEPGIFYHGQTHEPEADEHGIVTHKAFTSWSSNPSVGMQFTKHKGHDKDKEVEAHHIMIMHHDPQNSAGHALYSLHSKEHSSAPKREEEAVGGPVKYKITKSDYVGDHPETGKPVFEYHVTPHEAHPHWNANVKGPLTDAEKHSIKTW